VAQAVFLLLAVLVIFLNLIADISYGYLDPRVEIDMDEAVGVQQ
jgi:ABC-type dipeptide/oligopeptide/nickel transport system permease component